VIDDWLGQIPRFPVKTFEGTFHLKHHKADTIINHLTKYDTFWRQTVCRAGKPSIYPYVKFLCAQTMLCHSVSASAFINYFQMGETTSRRCLSKLTTGMVQCNALANIHLRKPTKSDARNIVELQQADHKIPAMMGSLDITKVHWKNCPTAWKGQFSRTREITGLGLEAVVDHSLWFWYAEFGYPGTLNDINVWKCSALFKSMINVDHEKLDFDFVVDGEVFLKLFNVVDGIYPSLTQFLLAELDPHINIACSFAADQEAHRKDIERVSGVLKIKYVLLLPPINLHYHNDTY